MVEEAIGGELDAVSVKDARDSFAHGLVGGGVEWLGNWFIPANDLRGPLLDRVFWRLLIKSR